MSVLVLLYGKAKVPGKCNGLSSILARLWLSPPYRPGFIVSEISGVELSLSFLCFSSSPLDPYSSRLASCQFELLQQTGMLFCF